MQVGGCAGIDAEAYAELLEGILNDFVVAVNHLLGCDAFFASAESHGDSMLIAASYHHYILSPQAQEASVDVGGDIDSGEVTDVDRSVGIGEGSGDEGALIFLFHE